MSGMYRYKIVVAYDGTNYHGWQQQPGLPTIVQTLQDTFKVIFGRSALVLGASRTDAGVHALGQVAVVKTDLCIDPVRLLFAWNNLLPPHVSIRSLERVSDEYSPFDGVVQKTYFYHFFLQKPLPHVQHYGWYFRRNVDLEKLRAALQLFVGTHDFRSFITGDDCGDDTIRTIDAIDLTYIPAMNAYRIAVRGPKFLRHMIRRLSGAAIYSSSRPDLSLEYINGVLAAKNPEHLLPNAPAKGLLLYTIDYDSPMKEELHEQALFFG